MRSLILITLTFFSAIGCSNTDSDYSEPSFPKNDSAICRYLSDDPLEITYPKDIIIANDNVLILSSSHGKWIHRYSTHDGSYLGSFAVNGRGPGEILSAASIVMDRDGKTLSVFDSSTKRLVHYEVDGRFLSEIPADSSASVVRRAWYLKKDSILYDGQFDTEPGEQGRFALADNSGVMNVYNDFPVDDKVQRLAFISTPVTISPNGKMMATGTFMGAILEIFALDRDLSKVTERDMYPPLVEFKNGSLWETPQMYFGFSDLTSTDKRIYSILIGSKNPEDLNAISVFNWNGKESIHYSIDIPVFKIAAQNDKELYGISMADNEFYLVKIELP